VSVSGLNHLNVLTKLEQLSIRDALQDGAGLRFDQLTHLTQLNLGLRYAEDPLDVGAARDEDLAGLAGLTRLKILQIIPRSPQLTDAGMACLAPLTAIEDLSIGGDGLTDRSLAYITGMPRLYVLRIGGDFTDAGLRQLGVLTRLKVLSIDSKHGMSRQTEDYLRRSLPNLYDNTDLDGVPGASID
jgi:hypothetical protein